MPYRFTIGPPPVRTISPINSLPIWVGLLSLAAISTTGCTDRLETGSANGNSTLLSGLDEENTDENVNRYDWLRLAQKVGLRGAAPTSFDRARGSAGPQRNQFVMRPANGSFPGGNLSYPLGAGNYSFAGGNLSFPMGSNMTFAAAANGSFPAGFPNSSFPRGGRWIGPQGNSSYPALGNTSFPAGGNVSYGSGRFLPPRGAGSRGLPLGGGNVTYGQGFPGFPGGGGSPNATFPR